MRLEAERQLKQEQANEEYDDGRAKDDDGFIVKKQMQHDFARKMDL